MLFPRLAARKENYAPPEYPGNTSATISWSPDGRWIAFSDWLPQDNHTGIYLLSTETWETERIPNGPKCLGQVQPAFSHSGEYLAYWCFRSGNEAVLYSLPFRVVSRKWFRHFGLVQPG